MLPDESKLSAVKEFPVPTTTKKLKGFLGLAGYYRRFMPNFSKTAKPLTSLLKNNTPFIWNADTDKAFNTLKQLLTGKLKLSNLCKGYGSRILIQTQLTISTNNTDKDIIPHLPLEFDCCEFQGRNFSLNYIHLNLPLNNVIIWMI